MKIKKIVLLSISALSILGVFYFITNNKKSNDISKINNSFLKKDINKTSTNTENLISKIKYTKVTLPKEIKDIQSELVDIQNGIEKDKILLSNQAKIVLADYENIDQEIIDAESLLATINKELNLPQEKIDEIENTYDTIISSNVTSTKSIAVQNNLIQIDEKILNLEKEFELLQKGELK